MAQVYNGGGMTTYPKQLMMREVKAGIEEAGLEVYDPSSQPFNDKKDVGGADIATKIVAKDTEAIYNSDIRLMNTQEDNLGTCIEAGIIKGYTDHALAMLQVIETLSQKTEKTAEEVVDIIYASCQAEVLKDYVPYHTDIRIHDEPEAGFKRSVGFHQFLRGVNLTLGGYHQDFGKEGFDGFFSLSDAMEVLHEISDTKAEGMLSATYNPIHITVDDLGRLKAHVKEV